MAAYKIRAGAIFECKNIEKIIEDVLLNRSKEKVAEIVLDICRNTGTEDQLIINLTRLLNYDVLKDKQMSCKHLFDLVCLLIDKKIPASLFESLKKLMRSIRRAEIIEESEEVENELLMGYIVLILKIYKGLSVEIFEDLFSEKPDKFISYIINDCLFNLEPSKLRFKSPNLRSLGFRFIDEF